MGWDAVAALATAGAAVAAVSIWRADHRRARRARAGRVTVRLEMREVQRPSWAGHGTSVAREPHLVIRNGADAPAYDLNVRHATVEVDPLEVGLVPPGGEHAEGAADGLHPGPRPDSVELDTWFTMDERRWHIDARGRLSGGRRDRRKADPPVSPA